MFFYLAQNVAKIEAQTIGDRKRLHVKTHESRIEKERKLGRKNWKTSREVNKREGKKNKGRQD